MKISDLTQKNLLENPCWLLQEDYESVIPQNKEINIEESSPYISRVKYTMPDNSVYYGFCFVYDCTGFILFNNQSQINISNYRFATEQEKRKLCKELGKAQNQIFPIKFEAEIKVYDSLESGYIE